MSFPFTIWATREAQFSLNSMKKTPVEGRFCPGDTLALLLCLTLGEDTSHQTCPEVYDLAHQWSKDDKSSAETFPMHWVELGLPEGHGQDLKHGQGLQWCYHTPEMPRVTWSWKRQGRIFPLETSEREWS